MTSDNKKSGNNTRSGERSHPANVSKAECASCHCPIFRQGSCGDGFIPWMSDLYTCGMFAWAGNATQPGGLYRIRATGQQVYLPIGLMARNNGMQIKFSGALDATTTLDPSRFSVRTWSLKRTADYGSKHYDETTLAVESVKLSEDQRTVILKSRTSNRPGACRSSTNCRAQLVNPSMDSFITRSTHLAIEFANGLQSFLGVLVLRTVEN